MKKLLIKNGRIIDPFSKIDAKRDLLIVDGKIKKVAVKIPSKGIKTIIDAKNKLVMPGLIDMHVHLRDPGKSDAEDIYSGTRAAAKGGFTSLLNMANTNPVVDNVAVLSYVKEKALNEGLVNLFQVGGVTKGLQGEEITEMGLMYQAGAKAFSDDGHPIMNAAVMRRVLEYTKQFNVPIISHAEDLHLSDGGSMNESYYSTLWGLPGISSLSEEMMVARDLRLVSEFGGKLHIAHVSTKESVDLIRKAKKKGVAVTCETAPHYFTLTEEDVEGYRTEMKMKPPLRSRSDREAIVKGVCDGTIDAIASDHAPHTIEEKDVEFNRAPFGIVGLETSLSLTMTYLVEGGLIDLSRLVELMSVNPARILGLNRGSLKVGEVADVTIIDPQKEVKVDVDAFISKSKNSPYHDFLLKGAATEVIVSGKLVLKDGTLLG